MNTILWSGVKAALPTLVSVPGGYTTAQRGIVRLPGAQKVFVKIGRDDLTKRWAHKEIQVYRFLQSRGYLLVPNLLAVNEDETAFALEVLDDGWDWSDTWTSERLNATLAAMDDLATLTPNGDDMKLFEKSFVSETADGWRPLSGNGQLQETLRAKLAAKGRQDIVDTLDFDDAAQKSSTFVFQRVALVHNDIRADNCAWNEALQAVRLIDWNWAQLGDRRIDVCSFLVHVHKTGFDITDYRDRLDRDALHWLAGFWFNAAASSIQEGGAEQTALRDYQLASGMVAFDLVQSL